VPQVITPHNGNVIRLAPGPAQIVDHVPTGRFAVDDDLLVSTDSDALRARRRLMHNGIVVVTIAVGADGPDVRVSVHGIAAEPGENLADEIGTEIEDQIGRAARKSLSDPDELETFARRAINRVVRSVSQKRPLVDVQVILPSRQGQGQRHREAVK